MIRNAQPGGLGWSAEETDQDDDRHHIGEYLDQFDGDRAEALHPDLQCIHQTEKQTTDEYIPWFPITDDQRRKRYKTSAGCHVSDKLRAVRYG